jgi:hypothetical protein
MLPLPARQAGAVGIRLIAASSCAKGKRLIDEEQVIVDPAETGVACVHQQGDHAFLAALSALVPENREMGNDRAYIEGFGACH